MNNQYIKKIHIIRALFVVILFSSVSYALDSNFKRQPDGSYTLEEEKGKYTRRPDGTYVLGEEKGRYIRYPDGTYVYWRRE